MDLLRIAILFCFIFQVPSPAVADHFVYPVGHPDERPTDAPGNANGYFVFQDFEFEVDNCHAGVDLAQDEGQAEEEVRAIGPGTVVDQRTGYGRGWGNAVLIRHDLPDASFYSLYAHLLDGSVEVGLRCSGGTSDGSFCSDDVDCPSGSCIGDEVGRGQPIGKVGNTGKSDGPHLHFTVKRTVGFGAGYMNVCDAGEARRCSNDLNKKCRVDLNVA